jgi:hypothetical protein
MSLAPNAADAAVANRLRVAVVVTVLLALFEEALGLRDLVSPPHQELATFFSFGNWFLASAFLGSFVIFAASRVERITLARTALLGLSLDGGIAFARHAQGQHPISIFMNLGAGLGFASIVTALWNGFRSSKDDLVTRTERLTTLFSCALIPTFIVLARALLDLTVALHPITYDSFLLLADASFPVQPSFTVGRWLGTSGPLHGFILFVYVQLPLALSLIYARRTRTSRPRFELLTAFIVAGLVGFAMYHVFPAVGPKLMSGEQWPNLYPTVLEIGRSPVYAPPAFRNCIPSLHTTWALFLVWYARPLAMPLRVFSALWLLLTLVATLGLGEHYLMDLVIAVPFALGVRALTASDVAWTSPVRAISLGLGTTLMSAWLVVLRFEAEFVSTHPGSIVLASLATVALGLSFEQRLEASRRH